MSQLQNLQHRPEGPTVNRPDRQVGIGGIIIRSTEGAALISFAKLGFCETLASVFVPRLQRSSTTQPIPRAHARGY
jgi:hypothetical protein